MVAATVEHFGRLDAVYHCAVDVPFVNSQDRRLTELGEGPAPMLSPTVRRAAVRAGCRLRSDASAVGIHMLLSDVTPLHVDNPDYSRQVLPPTNGHHRPIWANWG